MNETSLRRVPAMLQWAFAAVAAVLLITGAFSVRARAEEQVSSHDAEEIKRLLEQDGDVYITLDDDIGDYQAGVDIELNAPLNSYKVSDREPKDFDGKEQ